MARHTVTLKMLEAQVGGLSRPSKIPTYCYNIPATECKTGGKLRKVKGSVCSGCYALKGRYVFPVVVAAMYRRFKLLDSPNWVSAMAELINRRKLQYFRWHDAGDCQSVVHLERIAEVCRLTPNTLHWLPTREYAIVRQWLASHDKPVNLNIRLSAHMVGGFVPSFTGMADVTISTVTDHATADVDAYNCPASLQGNQCGDCRACWEPAVRRINYIKH